MAGRGKGHFELHFQESSWTRLWERLEVVRWGSWVLCAHTLPAACYLDESTCPYMSHCYLHKDSYHRKFISHYVIKALLLHTAVCKIKLLKL